MRKFSLPFIQFFLVINFIFIPIATQATQEKVVEKSFYVAVDSHLLGVRVHYNTRNGSRSFPIYSSWRNPIFISGVTGALVITPVIKDMQPSIFHEPATIKCERINFSKGRCKVKT